MADIAPPGKHTEQNKHDGAVDLNQILQHVSRSFYLTIRVLPAQVREVVGVAYLLARAADTLADTDVLAPPRRLELLRAFQTQLQGRPAQDGLAELAGALPSRHHNPYEIALLSHLGDVLAILARLPQEDRTDILAVLTTLIQGMVWDLEFFDTGENEPKALATPQALETYIYQVAGCVGEFWTRVTMRHVPALQRWDAARVITLGVHYGKALQLTNVLRDIRQDLALKRCYLPQSQLAVLGLTAPDLLTPAGGNTVRPLLQTWLETAVTYYADAETYALAIPRRCVRLRLAALWPQLIGLKTLARLAIHPNYVLEEQPVKIRRREVYGIMLGTLFLAGSNTLLRCWLRRLRADVGRHKP